MIGFWGELFVIAYATNPPLLVRAWRQAPEARFDFASGLERLEVKTAAGRIRAHHFSLTQLAFPQTLQVLIASVLVERSAAGPSIGELLMAIKSTVATDAAQLLHVDSVVASSLGAEASNAMDERFDDELARESLAFFSPVDVPQPPGPMPPAVSGVQFVADLSSAPTMTDHAPIPASGLLAAATRRRAGRHIRS